MMVYSGQNGKREESRLLAVTEPVRSFVGVHSTSHDRTEMRSVNLRSLHFSFYLEVPTNQDYGWIPYPKARSP